MAYYLHLVYVFLITPMSWLLVETNTDPEDSIAVVLTIISRSSWDTLSFSWFFLQVNDNFLVWYSTQPIT